MTHREELFISLKRKMEDCGFQFEKEQKPHRQKRKESELVFIHPNLIKNFEKNGIKVSAKKFYIKPLSDEAECEVGFVTGNSSPLHHMCDFIKPNTIDFYRDTPAWTNKESDSALDHLLIQIKSYINLPIKIDDKNISTFLFTWNPSRWPWNHLEQSIDQLNNTGYTTEAWSCSSFKKVNIGDRAFLMKVGSEPKGIIASGTIISNPFYSEFRTGDTDANPRMRVIIQFDVLLNAAEEPILPLHMLTTGNLSAQRWTPEASGISIRPELVDELEALWFNFVTTQKIRHNPFSLSSTGTQTVYTEGTPNQVTMTKYERNPFARKACIAHYGLSCSVCDFNFEAQYGEIGKDFIHVHHLTQIANVGKQYSVDPIRDLRPVCPNCHAMIHKGKEAISIDELKSLLQKRVSV